MMNKSLHDLLSCCSCLGSEKLTERKQGASKLEFLLKDNEVVHALDERSVRKSRSRDDCLNWDYLVEQIRRYVHIEVDSIKGDPSSTACKKKHKEIAQLYQCVVVKAEKRGPILKSASVYSHILDMFFKVDKNSCFVEIYSNILVKCLLGKRKHTCELGVKKWHEFVSFYFNILLNSNERNKGSQIPYARCIQQLLVLSQTMPYIHVEEILNNFNEIFKNIRQEKNHVFLELILSALVSFCWATVTDARGQICELGEANFNLFVQLWKYQITSIKVQLIDFFQLQVFAHFASNMQLIQDRTYPWMNDSWQGYLKEIFKLIYAEFLQLGEKIQISSSKSLFQRKEMIEFVASVIHQIYLYTSDQLDITISCTISCTMSKKSKVNLQSVWNLLIDGLKDVSEPKACIVWLDVVSCLFSKEYLAISGSEQILQVINVLAGIVTENNREDVTKDVVKTLNCALNHLCGKSELLDGMHDVINLIWNSSIKLIELSEEKDSIFRLLSSCWKTGMISSKFDIFKIFDNQGCQRSYYSMKLLCCILQSSNFPRCPSSLESSAGHEVTLREHPLRKQLLEWLLPPQNQEVIEPLIYKKTGADVQRDELEILCTLLASLVCISPSNIASDILIREQPKTNIRMSFKEMQMEYLIYMHGLAVDMDTKAVKGESSGCVSNIKSKCLKEAEMYLLKKIEIMVTDVLSSSERDAQMCIAELFTFMVLLHDKLHSITAVDTLVNFLQDSAGKLMSKFIAAVEELISCEIETASKAKTITSYLKCFYCLVFSHRPVNITHYVPESLIELLTQITEGDFATITQMTQHRTFDQMNHSASFDDMDIDCDQSDELNNKSASKGNNHPLDVYSLNEAEKVQLSAFEIVVRLMFLNPDKYSLQRRNFFQVFMENGQENSCRLQMLVILNTMVEEERFLVSSNELLVIVNCARRFLSAYRFDMDVCAAILTGMVCYINQIVLLNEEENNSESKMTVLKVVEVFWSLRNEKYSPYVRIKLADTFIALSKISYPDVDWKLTLANKNDGTDMLVYASELLVEMLFDNNLLVRSYAAIHLDCLFTDNIGHNKIFGFVVTALDHLINLENSYSSKDDLFFTHEITVLLVSKKLICCCSVLERKGLWLLFQFAKHQVVKPEHVFKVLRDIAVTFGYDDVCDLIAPRIMYIIFTFILKGFSIDTFPSGCLGLTSTDFLRTYYQYIVPCYVLRNDFDAINDISNHLGFNYDLHRLLMDSFELTVVHTLPIYSGYIDGSGDIDEKKTLILEGSKQFRNCIGEEIYGLELEKRFDAIVFQLILRLHDPQKADLALSRFTLETDASPYYPTFTSTQISISLSHLAVGLGKDTTISSFLKFPESIPSILCNLALQVTSSKRLNEKLSPIMSYYYFSMFLLENLHHLENYGGDYIIREITYRVLYFLEESDDESSEDNSRTISIYFEIFETLCEKISNHLYVSKELSKHICFIVSKLIHFSSKGSTSMQALKIMQCLIADSTQNEDFLEYINAVAVLDEFPSQQKFANLNDSLVAIKRNRSAKGFDEELKRVASNLLQLNTSVPNSVLENLKRILSENSDSVVLGEPLNNIVSCLMRICYQGDAESAGLAVECLGLVGPLPISALSGGEYTHSSELPLHLFSTCPLKFHVVVEALLQLCIHKCSLVSKTAWDCLLRLIKWDAAKAILLSYKEMAFFTYIHPYLTKRKKVDKLKNITCNPSFEKLSNGILCDEEKAFDSETPHDVWLQNLVSTLLTSAPVQDKIFLVLNPLCQLHVDFARLLFTFVVHNMIISHDENKKFMNMVCQSWIDCFLSADPETRKSKDMMKKVMDIIYLITSLRSIYIAGNKSNGVTSWNNNFWLDIDYLRLAEAAYLCGQYYDAAMFIEIWSDPLRTPDEPDLNETRIDQQSGTVFNCTSAESQSLLYNIYSKIGDVDAIYGVDTNRSTQTQKRLQLLQCEKEFHKALLSSDLNCASMKCSSDVLQTLMQSGLHHTALIYLQSVSDEEVEKYSEIQFEAAWRNGIWNTTQLRQGLSSKLGFHGNIYQSFISLQMQEEEQFRKHLKESKLSIVKSIQTESNSCESLYGILSKCYTLNSLQLAGECTIKKNIDAIRCPSKLSNDFSYYEPSLSVVSQVIKMSCISMVQDQETDGLENSMRLLIDHCKLARESQRYEVAEKFISMLSTQRGIADASSEWKLEEAKVYWDRKETNHAMHVLRQLMNKLKVESDKTHYLYPVVLGLYGHWLGETKSQNPVHIMDKYLEPAICMMEEESFSSCYSPIDAYHSLAKYADAQYQSLRDYVKSPMFQMKQTVIKRNQDELNKYRAEGKKQNTDRMVEIHFKMLEKQCLEDESELQQTLRDHQTFLEKAVQNYCKCLQHGDKYNLKVLRLCSLWFEHYSDDFVNNQAKIGFSKIKPSKFLPVMYQLAARLGTKMTVQCNTFKEILESVIERCCIDHPHHSIFILLALCNADYEENLTAKLKKRQSKGAGKSEADDSDKGRINAAKAVLSRIRSSKVHLVQDAEKLAMAYIDLAYWDITHLKTEKGSFMIPDGRPIRKISSLSSIAIPTVEVEIDPSCEYENVIHIHKFDQSFTHAGGVNLPKIITCIGSDGNRRKQLIKGRDDLRQDAVMQQVFGVANLLLKSDPESRRRDLRMRTYKIVPLSRKSGLMEWCEGTIPLGNYLIGGRDGTIGAHTRYYPKDWSIKECRTRLVNATVTDGKKSKFNVYQEIQKHFHPVFRHFFYEKFRDPADWFGKRLCYTRSTAVCSIVGYILGLGDRHCQNILVDCNSAEVVHIDLGVAFEKGKLLPTPETIPFRLTRDIIDGMGINGIEGVFRRCCEKTMSIMRSSQEGILTIVEVLLYDPLSDWTITSEKLKKLQKERDSEENGDDDSSNGISTDNYNQVDTDRNKTAERVLMRLKQKLAGSEGGAFLGTQGHVNYLIQEACNPQNLCRLFPGWQPWL